MCKEHVVNDFYLMLVFVVWNLGAGLSHAQVFFGTPVDYAVGVSPGALVTTASNRVLIGNWDGTFQGSINYKVGLGPVSITIVDLDGDGNQDLAVAFHGDVSSQQLGGVSLLVGNGDGTLRPLSGFPSSDLSARHCAWTLKKALTRTESTRSGYPRVQDGKYGAGITGIAPFSGSSPET